MKRWIVMIAALGFGYSAHAVTVINLDDVAHAVVFEDTPGSKQVRFVEPGESFNSLRHGGEIYLERRSDRRIRFNANDVLAIWDEGNLQIQVRRKTRGQVF